MSRSLDRLLQVAFHKLSAQKNHLCVKKPKLTLPQEIYSNRCHNCEIFGKTIELYYYLNPSVQSQQQ